MIGKIIKRKDGSAGSFFALNKYILAGKDKVEYANCVNTFFDDPEVCAVEMETAARCSKARKPVLHILLSWQAGEEPTHEQCDQAVLILLEELDLSGHQCVYSLHQNTHNYHLHVSVSKVNPETYKSIDAANGYTEIAAEKAARWIEYHQGWTVEDNPWHIITADGKIIENPDYVKEGKNRRIAQKIVDKENQYGNKSAVRIAQEVAKERILAAQNWQEVHQSLAEIGCRYERKGGGAIVWIGNIPVKASSIDKKCGLNKLQARFDRKQNRAGVFEPAPEGLHVNTKVVTEETTDAKEQTTALQEEIKKRILAAQNWQEVHQSLAEIGCRYEKKGSGAVVWIGETPIKASDIGSKCSVKKLQDRFDKLHGIVGGEFEPAPEWLEINREHVTITKPQPLAEYATAAEKKPKKIDLQQQYWKDRREYYLKRKTAKSELKKQHKVEYRELKEQQAAERKELAAQGWKGRGKALNAKRSIMKSTHAGELSELKIKQKQQTAQFAAEHPRFPNYEDWLKQQNEKNEATEWRFRRLRANELSREDNNFVKPEPIKDIRAFIPEIDAKTGYVTYKDMDTRRAAFVDRGKCIRVHETDDKTILASLQLAQAKWGRVKLSGTPEYLAKCVQIAAQNGIKISNPELQENYAAVRKTHLAERRAEFTEPKPASTVTSTVDKQPRSSAPTQQVMTVQSSEEIDLQDVKNTEDNPKILTYYKVHYIVPDDAIDQDQYVFLPVELETEQRAESDQKMEIKYIQRHDNNVDEYVCGDEYIAIIPEGDYNEYFREDVEKTIRNEHERQYVKAQFRDADVINAVNIANYTYVGEIIGFTPNGYAIQSCFDKYGEEHYILHNLSNFSPKDKLYKDETVTITYNGFGYLADLVVELPQIEEEIQPPQQKSKDENER